MDEGTNELMQGVIKYWVLISAVCSFVGIIFAQIIAYQIFKAYMSWQISQLSTDINGVGAKVRDVEKKVDEHEIEQILRQGDLQQRIAELEGMLSVMVIPRQKNGEA